MTGRISAEGCFLPLLLDEVAVATGRGRLARRAAKMAALQRRPAKI